jgi:hypothetical protein
MYMYNYLYSIVFELFHEVQVKARKKPENFCTNGDGLKVVTNGSLSKVWRWVALLLIKVVSGVRKPKGQVPDYSALLHTPIFKRRY